MTRDSVITSSIVMWTTRLRFPAEAGVIFSQCHPNLLLKPPNRLSSVYWGVCWCNEADHSRLSTAEGNPGAVAMLPLYHLVAWCLVMRETLRWVGKSMEGNGRHFYTILLKVVAFTRIAASSLRKTSSCCYWLVVGHISVNFNWKKFVV